MDHRNKMTLLILFCVLGLSACSGGGGGDAGDSGGGPEIHSGGAGGLSMDAEHGKPAQSVGDIAGVWDQSAEVEKNGVTAFDEAYVVISESGMYAEYDFLGDDYAENYQNCYEQMTYGTITESGDGTFTLNVVSAGRLLEVDVRYSVVDGKLTAPASLFAPTSAVVSIPRADANISNETIESMICDSQF